MASALAQDFPREEREILVVDDGSADDTAARMRRFGNAIRYLYKANGGQASAFNYGFANARGEVIGCLTRTTCGAVPGRTVRSWRAGNGLKAT